ncbi:hypothetical protein Dgeo_2560 (plasmid) [Deinococcus geothermalis DSM 11300]|uniref:Uncharacterized protein n=1 Tax=Deinococcus geothermalis (strain DSM 11300 / CIP 105573 / AG-3a) TaxID=319795 RepID=Q1J3E0_DEIGD|nr:MULTISPECIES: hypothetical protein [Deinococcus]ABF43994.1 hypothetical protein Dgeo_2560 [Deinococcus geothermalis DSM 11300]MBI0445578.1 exo-alpha-sialidase [Deinococcus sp. DB0503]
MTTKRGGGFRLSHLLAGAVLAAVLGVGVQGWQMRLRASGAAGHLGGDFHALQVLRGGRLLYGQHAGVSVSTDGGRTWSPPDGAADALTLATSPASRVLVLAGHGVLKTSRDGGTSWQPATFGNLASTDLHGFAVSPDAPSVWYANIAGLGLYRTGDGRNWQVMSPDTANATALAVGPGQSPRLYALIPGEGLIVSADGINWQRAGRAPAAAASGLDVDPVSGDVYLAGPGGVWRSGDRGRSWAHLGLKEGALLVAADPADEARLYAVSEDGRVDRSLDGGQTWHWAGEGN